jgi:hydroxylamine dehydrogenase
MLTTKKKEYKFSLSLTKERRRPMRHNPRAKVFLSFFLVVFVFYLFVSVSGQVPVGEKNCITCHRTLAFGIVVQWEKSKHKEAGVGCDVCHGSDHSSLTDVGLAKMPTPQTCGNCHPDQFDGYKAGKRASA